MFRACYALIWPEDLVLVGRRDRVRTSGPILPKEMVVSN